MAIDSNAPDCPASDDASLDWHTAHQQQIAAYNAWAEQHPTFSAIVSEWRQQTQSQQAP
jgi:hypothetical protein